MTAREHLDLLNTAMVDLSGRTELLERWSARMASVLAGGGRVLTAGNGGSAAHAQHLASELVGRYRRERRALSAIALSADTAAVTAIANDYGYGNVFARGVAAHGRAGDVLVAISTSGSSRNVITAVDAARDAGMSTFALTGPGPNPLAGAADEALCVPGPTYTVQEVHQVAIHLLCEMIDDAICAIDGANVDALEHRDDRAAVRA
jgi:D-sedoheptulose 7-phosphate isomerase